MLKNYFKTTFRHLSQNKGYVAINVVGLGLGLTMCIVAYLNWSFSESFDLFHSNVDNIYRIYTAKEDTKEMLATVPAPLTAQIKNDIAGVKDAVNVDIWRPTINVGDQTFYQNVLFTESNFLKWFDFEILEGEAKIDDPSAVLITDQMAKKYFGKEKVIGKQLRLYSEAKRSRELLVTGVVANPPKNSSIYFDFITNTKNQFYVDGSRLESNDWKKWRNAIFLVLNESKDAPIIQKQLKQYVAAHRQARPDIGTENFFLKPMVGMAKKAREYRWDNLTQGIPPSAVWGNIVMALLLLLTACLNFANTTVSLAGKRLKEIGIRKVMGGTQKQLIGQLLLESLMICVMGLALSFLLTDWATLWYNKMWRWIDLQFVIMDNPEIIAFLIGTVLVATLLAGAYPAFYISSFNPNSIFKGGIKFGGSNLVSRALLGIQVAISLTAIVTGLSFYNNATFQQTTDLGFNRTEIQAIAMFDQSKHEVMTNELKQHPLIKATAGVRYHIGDSCPRLPFDLHGEKHEAEYMEVGENYLEVMDIKTVNGRAFDAAFETDFQNSIMVNEKFVRDLFLNKNPLGQEVTFHDTARYTIIGVVGDFMQDNFSDPLRPLVLKYCKPDRYGYMAVRSEAKDLREVKGIIENAWKKHFPSEPFRHFFQNEFLAEALEITKNIQQTTSVLAIIAVLMTVTGLFALMSLSVLKRMKEIAVRRVLGATTTNISYILNRNYFIIIILGILAGCIGGAYLSLALLESIYDVYAGVNSILLVVAGIISLLIVVFTVGIKIWQVMRLNPAEVLNGE